jgi:hypothetical protein
MMAWPDGDVNCFDRWLGMFFEGHGPGVVVIVLIVLID